MNIVIKQPYAQPCVLQQSEILLERDILTASIIQDMTVESTGQEVMEFNYSTDTQFNHEWMD